MDRNSEARTALKQQDTDLGQDLLRLFLLKHRPIPRRPACSRTSTVIVRKELLPFYYAIYDHDLCRFVELQFRSMKDGPLRSVPIPLGMAPPPPAP